MVHALVLWDLLRQVRSKDQQHCGVGGDLLERQPLGPARPSHSARSRRCPVHAPAVLGRWPGLSGWTAEVSRAGALSAAGGSRVAGRTLHLIPLCLPQQPRSKEESQVFGFV